MCANPTKAVLIGALLGCAACSSSSYSRVVSINPPEASLYIDGERVGTGDKRVQKFSFKKVKRHYLQAVHPDFNLEEMIITEAKLREMIKNNVDIRLTLMNR